MSKHFCLYGFLMLFVASLSLQYFRARMRRNIVRMAEEHIRGKEIESEWAASGAGLRAIFADFLRMRLLRKSTGHLPIHILKDLSKFKVLNAIELTTTISMLLVAAFAYKVCVQ